MHAESQILAEVPHHRALGHFLGNPVADLLRERRAEQRQQEGKESKEKFSKVGRGRQVREDQNNKRSYPVSVLDTIAGKRS